jgi:hypothetical protein
MSLELKVGKKQVLVTTAPKGAANLDPFRSFWIGYPFTIDSGKTVQIGEGYLAVYCSHDTNQPIPALGKDGPQLAAFGRVEEVEIADTDKNKIILKNLDYVGVKDFECANQAMQLHLFRFVGARENGIAGWIDESGWKLSAPALTQDKTDNTKPLWKRTVGYGVPAAGTATSPGRYAHFVSRYRTGSGIQMVEASLPFGAQSLFGFMLKHHNKKIPELKFTGTEPKSKEKATEPKGEEMHWTETIGPANVATKMPRGLAVIATGAFGVLRETKLLSDVWHKLLSGNNDFELCLALAEAISEATPSTPHTLRQFAQHVTDSVIRGGADSPQEFFCLRLDPSKLETFA